MLGTVLIDVYILVTLNIYILNILVKRLPESIKKKKNPFRWLIIKIQKHG